MPRCTNNKGFHVAKEVGSVLPGMMMRTGAEEVDCSLVFTPEGIILSFLPLPTFAQEILGRRPEAEKDFHKLKMDWLKRENESAQEIFKSSKKNFFIPYAKISKVEISKRLLGPCRLNLNTLDEVHHFKFYGVELDEVEAATRSVLPDTLPIMRVVELN